MRVDVIQLRRRGVKIPRAELEGPVRGVLKISRWQLHNQTEHRMVVCANITAFGAPGNPPCLPALNDAVVTRLDESGMIICGYQSVDGQRYKQAWFVLPLPAEK